MWITSMKLWIWIISFIHSSGYTGFCTGFFRFKVSKRAYDSNRCCEGPHSGFSRTHNVGNIGIYCQLCIPIYFQFPSLFALYDISKCDIRYQWVRAHYISRLKTLLVFSISKDTAKTKLAILASLYCWEFAKNPIAEDNSVHRLWYCTGKLT